MRRGDKILDELHRELLMYKEPLTDAERIKVSELHEKIQERL